MAQARTHQRNDRIVSAVSTGDGTSDHPDYATQTLFDHIKEKKVNCLFLLDQWKKKSAGFLATVSA